MILDFASTLIPFGALWNFKFSAESSQIFLHSFMFSACSQRITAKSSKKAESRRMNEKSFFECRSVISIPFEEILFIS
jgi:hypothetical protein